MALWDTSIISEQEIRDAARARYARVGPCRGCGADDCKLYQPQLRDGIRTTLAPLLCRTCCKSYNPAMVFKTPGILDVVKKEE